jgi:hypothetical protein
VATWVPKRGKVFDLDPKPRAVDADRDHAACTCMIDDVRDEFSRDERGVFTHVLAHAPVSAHLTNELPCDAGRGGSRLKGTMSDPSVQVVLAPHGVPLPYDRRI